MEFDIFGIDTPAKSKKDLKNQDKDMVIGNDMIVEDDFEDDSKMESASSVGTKRSVQKTSSGHLNNYQAAETTSQHYGQLGRDSDIIGSLNNTLSAMKNS